MSHLHDVLAGKAQARPGSALADILGAIEQAKATPPTNPYPASVIFAGMAYTWVVSAEAARYELAGRQAPWLRNACRERGIASSSLTRQQMIDALVSWQAEAETQTGWQPAPARHLDD